MDDGQCTADTPVVSSVTDFRPFEATAPYFIAILRAAQTRAPKLLDAKSVVDALFSLYCVDAVPFRDATQEVPIVTDTDMIGLCLHTARALYYGRGGIPLMRKRTNVPKHGPKIQQVNCWPRIEKAFRKMLGIRHGQRLTQDDLERRLFTDDSNDEAYALALAVTYMVLALKCGA